MDCLVVCDVANQVLNITFIWVILSFRLYNINSWLCFWCTGEKISAKFIDFYCTYQIKSEQQVVPCCFFFHNKANNSQFLVGISARVNAFGFYQSYSQYIYDRECRILSFTAVQGLPQFQASVWEQVASSPVVSHENPTLVSHTVQAS